MQTDQEPPQTIEVAAQVVEQEHRPFRIIWNAIVKTVKWGRDDPRSHAAIAALISWLFRPRTIGTSLATVFAVATVVTAILSYRALLAQNDLLRSQNGIAIQTATSQHQSTVKSEIAQRLAVLYDFPESYDPTSVASPADAIDVATMRSDQRTFAFRELARLNEELGTKVVARGVGLAGCDLSGMDLDGADLSHSDLRQVDFRNCSLKGADFTGSTLCGSTLVNAEVDDADFTSADCRKVRWSPLPAAIPSDMPVPGPSVDLAKLREASQRIAIRRLRESAASLLPPLDRTITLHTSVFELPFEPTESNLSEVATLDVLFERVAAIADPQMEILASVDNIGRPIERAEDLADFRSAMREHVDDESKIILLVGVDKFQHDFQAGLTIEVGPPLTDVPMVPPPWLLNGPPKDLADHPMGVVPTGHPVDSWRQSRRVIEDPTDATTESPAP